MERLYKTFISKGFLLCVTLLLLIGCAAPRPTVAIDEYVLLRGGKEVFGREKGLTAFLFENNPKKIPFSQFLSHKYNLGVYRDIEYWVTVDGHRLKIMLYESDEVEKYFDTSAFMVSNVEPDANIVGSKVKFLALSIINSFNEDCLSDDSLYQQVAIKYLRELKDEYYKS